MNRYLKTFLLRGMLFAGFGPIILAIIYFVLSEQISGFILNGKEVFCAILSTYLLAFVQAGSSVLNQIEHWPTAKSLMYHFAVLYLAYVFFYCINDWIPFEPIMLLIFTVTFALIYFAVWLTVYLSIRALSRKMNAKLK